MANPAPNLKAANHYRPAANEFGAFVAAVGKRYSGSYVLRSAPAGACAGRVPRVSYWTIWNEANQPGWLYPQWRAVAGRRVMNSPRLYRLYVDAAFAALRRTGHSPPTDTILIGELAPEGSEATAGRRCDPADPVHPGAVLRGQLVCAAARLAAALLHCPAGGGRRRVRPRAPRAVRGDGVRPPSVFVLPGAERPDERPELCSPGRPVAAGGGAGPRVLGLRRVTQVAAVPHRIRVRDQSAGSVPGRRR